MKGDKLSNRQRIFVEAYIRTWNASEAARIAGYKNRPNQAGSEVMTSNVVRRAINERLDEMVMKTNEILARISQQARGNISDFLIFDSRGILIGFNEDALREQGYMVRKLSTVDGRSTSLSIEMYDAQAALIALGRYRALFVDRSDVTSKGEKIIVTLGKDEDDDDDSD